MPAAPSACVGRMLALAFQCSFYNSLAVALGTYGSRAITVFIWSRLTQLETLQRGEWHPPGNQPPHLVPHLGVPHLALPRCWPDRAPSLQECARVPVVRNGASLRWLCRFCPASRSEWPDPDESRTAYRRYPRSS